MSDADNTEAEAASKKRNAAAKPKRAPAPKRPRQSATSNQSVDPRERNRDAWMVSISKNLQYAIKIVRGGKRKKSSFIPETDPFLEQKHCPREVWDTIESIRQMARPNAEGGGRAEAVKQFGERWLNKKMQELNSLVAGKVFGASPCFFTKQSSATINKNIDNDGDSSDEL
jgi:hypothetical protein